VVCSVTARGRRLGRIYWASSCTLSTEAVGFFFLFRSSSKFLPDCTPSHSIRLLFIVTAVRTQEPENPLWKILFVIRHSGFAWLGKESFSNFASVLSDPVVTIRTARFSVQKFCILPQNVFMCFVWVSEQTTIISLYSINWLVCITETECVYCAVRTVFMCFVWISEQTAIISPYNINWLVCITETECVYCAVRAGSLHCT
jgi:hypothetical protein